MGNTGWSCNKTSRHNINSQHNRIIQTQVCHWLNNSMQMIQTNNSNGMPGYRGVNAPHLVMTGYASASGFVKYRIEPHATCHLNSQMSFYVRIKIVIFHSSLCSQEAFTYLVATQITRWRQKFVTHIRVQFMAFGLSGGNGHSAAARVVVEHSAGRELVSVHNMAVTTAKAKMWKWRFVNKRFAIQVIKL